VIALYDMTWRSTTWDFFNWLAHVKLLGATEITFRIEPMSPAKYPPEEGRKRFENFIRFAPPLFDLPFRIGDDGDGYIGSQRLDVLLRDAALLGCDIPRMRLEQLPRRQQHRFTVTIRETFRNAHKNSDRELWLRFAETIGATVIEDHARAYIGLYDRLRLYAGADMNFGVVQGPLAALYYSNFPFAISCDPETSRKSFTGHGVKPGDQAACFLPNQRWIWERPTMDGLMREFERNDVCRVR